MKRIKVFAKGNLDVRDSLICMRSGSQVLWNGLNAALRQTCPGWTAQVRHETYTRSDALLRATGKVPACLSTAGLDLGPFPLSSQYSAAIFDGSWDVVVLSLMADVMDRLGRHRQEGWLIYPYEPRVGVNSDWYRTNLELLPLLSVEQSLGNLYAIISRIRERSDPEILVLNMSAVVPGERIHSYAGAPEALSTRIRRFNIGLIDVSASTGISVVDVDNLVARSGADRLKLDAVHLTADGARQVSEEVVRILHTAGRLSG